MTTVYARELTQLLAAIDDAEHGTLALDELQRRIYQTEVAITLHDERELRRALYDAENQLELIRFTELAATIRPKSLAVVAALKARIAAALG